VKTEVPEQTNNRLLLSIDEAADTISVGRTSFYGLLRDGKIKAVRALGAAFVVVSERALRRGPHSGYYEMADDLNEIRGRLDTNKQRRRFGLPLPVSVTFDEYGTDIPENQLLLGAIATLHRLASLPLDLHRRLRRLAASLDGVQPARPRDAQQRVRFTRLNEHYRSAVALARVVLTGQSFDLAAGHRSITGFTVNMNQLFESFLTVSLAETLERRHGGRLHAQRHDHLDRSRGIGIIPDLTWIIEKRPVAVLDAKYKILHDDRPADADLYQVIAYCVALEIETAYLVHATGTQRSVPVSVGEGDIRLHVVGLDLGASLPRLRSQIEALADDVATSVTCRKRGSPGFPTNKSALRSA
jgi:5-methylcytosine-specific restriction enzyme subunit McrC